MAVDDPNSKMLGTLTDFLPISQDRKDVVDKKRGSYSWRATAGHSSLAARHFVIGDIGFPFGVRETKSTGLEEETATKIGSDTARCSTAKPRRQLCT